MADTSGMYETGLDRTPANYVPLSPLSFLTRAARIYGPRTAVIHGDRRYTYTQFSERCRRLASALQKRGIGKGDTVAIMAPNVPEMIEAHYGVPMLGAVLCSINIRLDAPAVAFILEHSNSARPADRPRVQLRRLQGAGHGAGETHRHRHRRRARRLGREDRRNGL